MTTLGRSTPSTITGLRRKEEQIGEQRKTEIVAFCSGKGGTGKSLMCSCFGYALLRGGQRVLMIDGDPATDGLSLFLLGPKGQEQIPSFEEQNTFIGALDSFHKTGTARYEPRSIHRRGEDHGVTYHAIISGKGLYGEGILNMPVVPDLNQGSFRAGIRVLFDQLRTSGEYDYVLVDTRGGFAFESTDLCALADSFIVITEPDYTSFYQDRNLVSRVAAAARDLESPSLLRAMIVNKAVDVFPQQNTPYLDTLEVQFRNELVKEFPVRFQDTHPVPVSIEALLAYKAQKIPYRSAPESMFCLSTLAAFTDILGIVTSQWTVEQVDQWNALVDEVTQAVRRKQKQEAEKEQARVAREEEFERLRTSEMKGEARMAAMEREATASLETTKHQYELKVASLERELEQRSLQYEREFARSEALTTTTIALAGGTTANYPGVASATGSRPLPPSAPAFGEDPLSAKAAPVAAPSQLYTQRNLRIVIVSVLCGIVLALVVYLAWRLTSPRPAPETTSTEGSSGSRSTQDDARTGGVDGGGSSALPTGSRPAKRPLASETATTNGKAVAQTGGAPESARGSSYSVASTSPGLAGAAPGAAKPSGDPLSATPVERGAPDPGSGTDAARLHALAANESNQTSMVTLLCKAADLAPDNPQYVRDCDISKIALISADKQSLKTAQDASDTGRVEMARRYAKYVSPLSPELYRQAQALLMKLNGGNVAKSTQKNE